MKLNVKQRAEHRVCVPGNQKSRSPLDLTGVELLRVQKFLNVMGTCCDVPPLPQTGSQLYIFSVQLQLQLLKRFSSLERCRRCRWEHRNKLKCIAQWNWLNYLDLFWETSSLNWSRGKLVALQCELCCWIECLQLLGSLLYSFHIFHIFLFSFIS